MTIGSSGNVGDNPGPAWHPRRVGDYNGDGHNDVFWQHDNGSLAVWSLNDRQKLEGYSLPAQSTSWHPAATGDFNADGIADIFWHNDNGENKVWIFNLTADHYTEVSYGNQGAQWLPISAGYYNADDYADILWRNTQDGSVAIWDLQGAQFLGSFVLGAVTQDWQIII